MGEFAATGWAPDAPKYIKDCFEALEEFRWDWCYLSYGGYPVWNTDYDFTAPEKHVLAETQNERQKVLSE